MGQGSRRVWRRRSARQRGSPTQNRRQEREKRQFRTCFISSWHEIFLFSKKFGRTSVLFVGPWIYTHVLHFWWHLPDFQRQDRSLTFVLPCQFAVRHLLTSWCTAWQSSLFYIHILVHVRICSSRHDIFKKCNCCEIKNIIKMIIFIEMWTNLWLVQVKKVSSEFWTGN